jgi:heterodisulfide reductase subunit C
MIWCAAARRQPIEACPHNEVRYARTNTTFWDGNTDQVWRCLTCEAWLLRKGRKSYTADRPAGG